MNVYAWVLLTALAVAAGTSWVAMARGRRELEPLARAAVAVLLLALAWLLQADTVGYGRVLLVALLLGLAADALAGAGRWPTAATVLLLGSRLGYLAAVAGLPPGNGPALLGVLVVLVVLLAAGVVAWVRLVPAVREQGPAGMRRLGYAAIVVAVPLSAWCSGHALVGWGATLLAAGDALAAYDRRVRAVPGAGVAVVAAHDVGALALVLGMLRA